MNIFAFDGTPWTAALWLDDVRKNKMILETAQLLSTAIQWNNPGTKLPIYKPTHMSHPCSRWTSLSRGNYRWLLQYFMCLCDQKPRHSSAALADALVEYGETGSFMREEQTDFANCAANASQGLSFKHITPTTEAYRMYINERWKRDTIPLTWVYGEKPEWFGG